MDFTYIQKQVLDGCLLGDGSMIMHKKAKNACFQYLSSSKEHVEAVHKHFKEFCTENFNEVKRGEYFDKRTNKTYVHYYFRTKLLPIFTVQYNRWYKDVKIVPNDVIISGLSCLYWYLGDGELESSHGYIKLHTNSFTKKECESLCKKLGFKSKLQKKKEGVFLVSIPRSNVKNFLSYIGECPVKDYSHKWKQVPYKNKNIEKNGVRDHSSKYPKIVEDWFTKKYTLYQLSKKYDVDVTAIKNFFNKNSIYWKSCKTNKPILQLDLEGTVIKEWASGQEIARELGFSASAISACCREIRNTHNNYKWKFKSNEE